MFSNSSNSSPGKEVEDNGSPNVAGSPKVPHITIPSDTSTSGEKRANGNSSPGGRKSGDEPGGEKKRRSSGVAKARDMFATAKQSLHFYGSSPTSSQLDKKSSQHKQGKGDVALHVTQGSLNNSAGDSNPGPNSTFRVGVTEDKNKKCRRTMEDTHAYLYNFLNTPAPMNGPDSHARLRNMINDSNQNISTLQPVESDNGYFAIFDGHAGNFAADWCGKKLHILLEENIRKQPSTPIPELLDQTFTSVDQQLEKLPVKNSGCTAVIAVLRWEDRVPNSHSVTGSTSIAPAVATSLKASSEASTAQGQANEIADAEKSHGDGSESVTQNAMRSDESSDARLRDSATRQRVLYTANVGDARIVLCRNGRALRLSYDHKGSDENEGKRVANAGGLILNNRVNGVLAVTRALGDSYMKDLVTGHPYTTETVIQPDQDEFLILACDGLWDVCSDQEAVDLVRMTDDPQNASKILVDHALSRFSTDNLSCMIVRFDTKALKQQKQEPTLGVDKEPASLHENVSETDAILLRTKAHLDEDGDTAGTVTPDAIAEENANEVSEVYKNEAQSKS